RLSEYIITMRIIAGSKRGMKLFSPATRVSRPITDRVKESLFSVLYRYDLPANAVVADVFCGVGSLGLESLSRGAAFVTFIEQAPEIVATLERNIEKAGFVRNSKVIRTDAFRVAPAVGTGEDDYDLVFVDPPYADSTNAGADSPLADLLDLWVDQVAADGIVVVRTSKDVTLLDKYGRFRTEERREWGTMAVTILTKSKT
ncbi:MAG: RsmD family RNA methyltransferase, partial [Planctomycetota bacterium]|nr:RsmD family RNA methyltransferase [Planctomycetota bacterium]